MFFMGGTIYWDIFDGIPGASFDPSPRDRFVLEDLQIPGLAKHTKKLWNITIFHGQINYFDWAIFNSHVRLPEGNCRYGKKSCP